MNNIGISLLGIAFGLSVTWIFEFILKTHDGLRKRYYERHNIFLGYHVHHSVYGLISILLALNFFLTDHFFVGLFFIGVGIGVIIMHTLSENKFVFIEKELD